MHDSGPEAIYQLCVGIGANFIEAIAVALIVGYTFIATLSWLARVLWQRRFAPDQYQSFRSTLGRIMLLGLEILIAADVVRTVALERTLMSFATLGLLVLIRTLLSWSIVLEIEGRWPWQPRSADVSTASE